jgi:hypothetical protein
MKQAEDKDKEMLTNQGYAVNPVEKQMSPTNANPSKALLRSIDAKLGF